MYSVWVRTRKECHVPEYWEDHFQERENLPALIILMGEFPVGQISDNHCFASVIFFFFFSLWYLLKLLKRIPGKHNLIIYPSVNLCFNKIIVVSGLKGAWNSETRDIYFLEIFEKFKIFFLRFRSKEEKLPSS